MQGTVKFYNADKWFGFIVPEDGSEDLFFHITQCAEGYEPNENDIVTFVVGEGRDGRAAAQEVSFTGEQASGEEEGQQEEQSQEEEQTQE